MLARTARAVIDIISRIIHPLTKMTGRKSIRILCYHRVYHLSARTSAGMNIMCVEPEEFERQTDCLARHGYNVLTLAEVYEGLTGKRELPPKTIVITFDDGYRDNYKNAFRILSRHGLKATFFLATDYVNNDGIFPWLKLDDALREECEANRDDWRPMKEAEIKEMAGQGHCFGSHTRSHAALATLAGSDTETLKEELSGSLAAIKKLTGDGTQCFCYPFGSLSEAVKKQVIEAGYDIAVRSGGGSNSRGEDRYALKRITIEDRDSLSRFIRKIDGAYDWWYGGLLPLLTGSKNG